MEGEERVSSASVTSDSYPSPPLHDDGGSDPADEVAELEDHSPLSDEDQDQEHEHELDQDHDQDHTAETVTSVDDLKLRIIKQVEYYFSDENLPTDKFLIGFLRKNKEGFVPISVIASFKKMKKLTQDHLLIVAALKESSLLVVSGDGKSVKRLNPFQLHEVRDPKFFTVLVENLPEDHSKENIQRIFSEAGNIKKISIHDPCAMEGSQNPRKQKVMISRKLHALVEYKTIEAAEKAAATLNDEQDWRNGMRVKVLKKMTKHGHRKQAWKGSDSEKNSTSTRRVSELIGDGEHHSSNEHNEDTPDEEDGEHLSKDRGGQRNRNRGHSRKHKYRGMHGMGHGNTSSSHHSTEAPKPPPGPKMPDGTRGFTMGRGRVLGSSPNL